MRRPTSLVVGVMLSIVLALTASLACGGLRQVSLPEMALPLQEEAPPFKFVDQGGRQLSLSDLRGKVVLLNFIYTRCEDVCPVMNFQLKAAVQRLSAEQQARVAIVSISFDPEHDTPLVLTQYVKRYGFNLPGGWHFLTGSAEDIREIASLYGMRYEAVFGSEEAHSHDGDVHVHTANHEHEVEEFLGFTHSNLIVLIDPDGMIRKRYTTGALVTQDELSNNLLALLAP